MLCVADRYAVINLTSISEKERGGVWQVLERTGKKVVEITHMQMEQFAGNMLQLENKNGKRHLVLSSRAYRSLLPKQVALLALYNPIIHAPLDTIEQNGGGSARCMMAEIFLPVKNDNT